MDKKIIFAAVLIIGLVGLAYIKKKPADAPSAPQIETPAVQEETDNLSDSEPLIEEGLISGPEMTVSDFMDSFIASAPPAEDPNALMVANSLLSEGARMGKPEMSSGEIALMMGVQDIPDEGYLLGEVSYRDDQALQMPGGLAELEVTLNYSGGETKRIFLLSKSGDAWLIDAIKPLD